MHLPESVGVTEMPVSGGCNDAVRAELLQAGDALPYFFHIRCFRRKRNVFVEVVHCAHPVAFGRQNGP